MSNTSSSIPMKQDPPSEVQDHFNNYETLMARALKGVDLPPIKQKTNNTKTQSLPSNTPQAEETITIPEDIIVAHNDKKSALRHDTPPRPRRNGLKGLKGTLGLSFATVTVLAGLIYVKPTDEMPAFIHPLADTIKQAVNGSIDIVSKYIPK